MKTTPRLIGSILTVAGILAAAAGAGIAGEAIDRDSAFTIDRFDQYVAIRGDGQTLVIEELDVTFTQERRGIFRELDATPRFPSTGGYNDFRVDRNDPSQPWQFAVEAGTSGPRIRIGDPNVYLDPGTYPYRIGYTAPSWYYELADDPGTVEVRIDSPGFDWPTSIDASSLTLELPGPAQEASCVEGPSRTTEACASSPTIDGNRVHFEFSPFEPRQSATVSVLLDLDAFDGSVFVPTYETEPLGDREGLAPGPWPLSSVQAALLLALLISLPILGWEFVLARAVYRDRVTDPALHDRQHPSALPAPPFGMRPTEVAGLLLRRAAAPLFLANLVDLDQRGAVSAEASTTPGKRKRDDDTQVLTVSQRLAYHELHPNDAELVRALNPDGYSTTFDGEYEPKVAERVGKVQQILTGRAKSVFEAHGFAHDGGGPLAEVWVRVIATVGIVVLAAAFTFLVTIATPLHPVAGIIIVVLLLTAWGILSEVWKHHRLPLNSEGRDATAQARAFDEFIRTVEGEQLEWAAGQPGIDHLHPAVSLLPYAIALGHADSWHERFSSVMEELAVTAGGGPGSSATHGAAWWATASTFNSVQASQSATSTAPSSSGGGGGGSGGGGGGGGSW